jgi:hypothetical protein
VVIPETVSLVSIAGYRHLRSSERSRTIFMNRGQTWW